jgi:hypothetical protein
VLAGVVGLVAAPAIGAAQDGFVGFAKGAAAGLAGAVVLPVTGVAVGAAQVVRGIAAQPGAMKEAAKGKHWDQASHLWGAPGGGGRGLYRRRAGEAATTSGVRLGWVTGPANRRFRRSPERMLAAAAGLNPPLPIPSNRAPPPPNLALAQGQRQWVADPGTALAVDDGVGRGAWQRAQRAAAGADDYYSLLGVDASSTPEEIKRQYYLLARRWVPQ